MKKFVLFFLFSLFFSNLQGQTSINVQIKPLFNSSIVESNTNYELDDKQFIRFETIKFYISNVQLLKDDSLVFQEIDSYHLIDAFTPGALAFQLPFASNKSFNIIKLSLGIDSLTNSLGAKGGELDPTTGMYWTWQSGYINSKIEGTFLTEGKVASKFQFHLGGFLSPFNAIQEITLKSSALKNIEIELDMKVVSEFLLESRKLNIMSPCNEAVSLSKQIATCFRLISE